MAEAFCGIRGFWRSSREAVFRGWVRWQTEDWEDEELKKCHSQGVQVREALALGVRQGQGRLEKILGQTVLKWEAVTGKRLAFLVFYAKKPFLV